MISPNSINKKNEPKLNLDYVQLDVIELLEKIKKQILIENENGGKN